MAAISDSAGVEFDELIDTGEAVVALLSTTVRIITSLICTGITGIL
jgi:hypothetical protein